MTEEEEEKKPYTSLRNPLAFPSFVTCPHEYTLSSTYYHQRGSPPIRHWCFLGEIENIFGIGRLGLDVKDKENNTIRIYFYLDRLPSTVVEVAFKHTGILYPQHPNIPRHRIRKGNTIAVLYAEQHPWKEGPSTGIRIEDGDTVQINAIFPCNLNKLLSISDQILQDSSHFKSSGLQTCDRCGEKPASLQRCSACHFAWYCNRDCQRADWSNKLDGHKKDCKLTEEVKLVMKQNWNDFEAYLKFPLFGGQDSDVYG